MRSGLDIHNDIVRNRDFQTWQYAGVGAKASVGKGTSIELVHLDEGLYGANSYGDHAPMGWKGEATLTFKVTQTGEDGEFHEFYRKFGTVSSYNNTSWDGIFIRVQPKEKKVVTYEFE